MRSHIVGKIEFDHERLLPDMATIRSIPRIDEEYDEFSSGYWTNVSLWNASGEHADTMYRDIPGSALPTEHGRSVPYIDEVIRTVFDTRHIKMVRARNLIDAILMPHRDFIELDKDNDRYFRAVIALEDNEHALHSDNESVLRMRKGEIWQLDAAAVHSAVNFSTRNRQAVCIDFAFDDDFHEREIFADTGYYQPNLPPDLPERRKFTEADRENLMNLSKVIDSENFKEIVCLLSKIHFRYDVPSGDTFDWLIDICEAAGDPVLLEKSEAMKKYMIGSRGFGERFSINPHN